MVQGQEGIYIRTEMPFGTRLNLKPFEVFEVHFPTERKWGERRQLFGAESSENRIERTLQYSERIYAVRSSPAGPTRNSH
jgi:hypothetical protein